MPTKKPDDEVVSKLKALVLMFNVFMIAVSLFSCHDVSTAYHSPLQVFYNEILQQKDYRLTRFLDLGKAQGISEDVINKHLAKQKAWPVLFSLCVHFASETT